MSGAKAPTIPATITADDEAGVRRIYLRIEAARMYPDGMWAMNIGANVMYPSCGL